MWSIVNPFFTNGKNRRITVAAVTAVIGCPILMDVGIRDTTTTGDMACLGLGSIMRTTTNMFGSAVSISVSVRDSTSTYARAHLASITWTSFFA